ncbi:MAG: carboxylesterase family protein [Saccharofermentanales bacterium]
MLNRIKFLIPALLIILLISGCKPQEPAVSSSIESSQIIESSDQITESSDVVSEEESFERVLEDWVFAYHYNSLVPLDCPLKYDKTLTITGIKETKYEFLCYLPKGFDLETSKDMPLIVFLHGRGQGDGGVMSLVNSVNGSTPIFAQGVNAIIVAPCGKPDESWTSEIKNLNIFLDYILSVLPVDKKRVYLAGTSMGGYGAWEWGMQNPEKFAAIVPVCGGGDPSRASALKDVPLWAFHGDKDEQVPVEGTIDMINAIKAAGGNPKFTKYKDVDHLQCHRLAFEDKEMYAWLFEQKVK